MPELDSSIPTFLVTAPYAASRLIHVRTFRNDARRTSHLENRRRMRGEGKRRFDKTNLHSGCVAAHRNETDLRNKKKRLIKFILKY